MTLITTLCASGFSARAQDSTTESDDSAPEYLINFGDEIEVDIVGSTEYDWRGTPDSEGFLSQIPFVEKPIFALCQSEKAVAALLAKEFAVNLREPQVVVRILDRSKRPTAMVVGAVSKPQKYRIYRPVRLTELLVMSGGITSEAGGEIQILRQNSLGCRANVTSIESRTSTKRYEGQTASLANISYTVPTARGINPSVNSTISLLDLVKGDIESNPFVHSGDVVTVLEAQPLYVTGGVVAPQRIFYRAEMTLTRAIAVAGGFSPNSTTEKVTVYRRENGSTKIIAVDFEKIRRNDEKDFELKPFDIIEVPQNGRVKSLRQPAIVATTNRTASYSELSVRTVN